MNALSFHWDRPHGSGPHRGGTRAVWWALAVAVSAVSFFLVAHQNDAVAARKPVAPVLTCTSDMVLDTSSGRCRTPRTTTTARPSSCPARSVRVPGPYGGHVCQTKVINQHDTGRTKQVYSHSTYEKTWIATGTKRVQTGTSRVWVPPRTSIEMLTPPLRVQTGTRTESKVVTRPGPRVLYEVSYEVEIEVERVVQRCSFDPFAGRQCWNQTVTEVRTQTRTRLECCIAGPPLVTTVTTEVPVYEYQATRTVTIAGYWSRKPIYETRQTGYWDSVETRHYTTEPVYETQVTWVVSAVTPGPCPAGWQPSASRCSRTVLGDPSAAPTQSCPSGSVPRYGDVLGGFGSSVLTCRSSVPGSDLDTGTDPQDSGGPQNSPDGGARPLHHLAGESDERLAELGIHRCADGLLSYVPCDKLPGRTWNSEPDICDDITGTTYRADHGGTCVTESDLLNKCSQPGDCEETTVRTYCPAIGQLADTQIQEHAHSRRGTETYRVCIFDCSDFRSLPPYVQSRINGSYDYACLPADTPTTTTTTTATTTTASLSSDNTVDAQDIDDSPKVPVPDVPVPDVPVPKVPLPAPITVPTTTTTTTTTAVSTTASTTASTTQTPTLPPGEECAPTPSAVTAAVALDRLRWRSYVRSADVGKSSQRHLPGAGHYLQVAPGRGWAEVRGSADVSLGECRWIAAAVRVSWSEQRPWVVAERQAMEASADTRHLIKRWDALSADQRHLTQQWHQAVRDDAVCSVGDASGLDASKTCGWTLAHPAAYAWQASICFTAAPKGDISSGASPPPSDNCWVTLASGVDWIRSVSDYAAGRVTLTHNGARP